MNNAVLETSAPKLFYSSREVMQIFHISPDNYTTFGRICRKFKLPRIKVGKNILFPKDKFDRRVEVINENLMKNFNI